MQAQRVAGLLVIADPEDPRADGWLTELAAVRGPESVRKAATALAVRLRKDRADRGAVQEARMDAVASHAGQTLLRAAAPKDLDDILRELNDMRSGRSNSSDSYRANNQGQRVATLIRFVSRWQDYLADLAAGNSQAASGVLREMTQGENTTALDLSIPRSELLERMEKLRASLPASEGGPPAKSVLCFRPKFSQTKWSGG